jgi:hypothetical protein
MKHEKKLRSFDIVDYLDSEEAIAEYISQVLSDGIPRSCCVHLVTLRRPEAWRRSQETRDLGEKVSTKLWRRGLSPELTRCCA